MLVVNQGTSGRFHVFRGSRASIFLAGLTVTNVQYCIIRLPSDHREPGRLFVTAAGTYALALNPESLSNEMAKLAYRVAVAAVNKRLEDRHESN